MRFCVFGAGNMGVLTSFFLRNSEPVLFSRRAQGCRKERMSLVARSGVLYFDVELCGLEASVNCDVAVFASKAYEVSDYVRGFGGSYAEAFCLQNGFGTWEEASSRATISRAFPMPVTYGANRVGGVVTIAGEGAYHIGGYRRARPLYGKELAEELRRGGANVVEVDDVEPYVWLKLVVNAAINPLTALLSVPNRAVIEIPWLRELAMMLAEEVATLARREGVRLLGDPFDYVTEVARRTGDNLSSMLQDVLQGRRTEIDYISGFVARRSRELGMRAPFNEAMLHLIKALEERRRGGP